MTRLDVTMFKRAGVGLDPKSISPNTEELEWLGQPVNFPAQLNIWSFKVCEKDLMAFFAEPVPAGIYHRVVDGDLRFALGEAFLNHEEVERLDFHVEYKVTVTTVLIVSHFELKSRGRCITFAPQLIGNDTMQWQVVLPSTN